MPTQALVDSICRDVRSYLHIPPTFEEKHILQLAQAIRNSSSSVQHVTVAARFKPLLHPLLQQVTSTLTTLDVTEPTVENMNAIIQLIQETSTLTTLSLHGIPLDESSLQDLVDALIQHNSSIKVLDLADNHFSNNDTTVINSLSRLLQKSTTLECIMLNKNELERIEWLATSLKRNTSLKMLSLADNQISDLKPLATLLKGDNMTIQRIYLFGNKFALNDAWKRQISIQLRLNLMRRRLVISEEDNMEIGLYPEILANISHEPALLYGLFRELPQAWPRR